MDVFDFVMLLFFLLIPCAMIVFLVLWLKARRTLRETEMALVTLNEQLQTANNRLWELTHPGAPPKATDGEKNKF